MPRFKGVFEDPAEVSDAAPRLNATLSIACFLTCVAAVVLFVPEEPFRCKKSLVSTCKDMKIENDCLGFKSVACNEGISSTPGFGIVDQCGTTTIKSVESCRAFYQRRFPMDSDYDKCPLKDFGATYETSTNPALAGTPHEMEIECCGCCGGDGLGDCVGEESPAFQALKDSRIDPASSAEVPSP